MLDQLQHLTTKEDFNPMFTHVVNRKGYFIMSEETYNAYSQDILKRTGGRTTFNQWLHQKNYAFISLDNGAIKIIRG
jgi:hypothetical protein